MHCTLAPGAGDLNTLSPLDAESHAASDLCSTLVRIDEEKNRRKLKDKFLRREGRKHVPVASPGAGGSGGGESNEQVQWHLDYEPMHTLLRSGLTDLAVGNGGDSSRYVCVAV